MNGQLLAASAEMQPFAHAPEVTEDEPLKKEAASVTLEAPQAPEARSASPSRGSSTRSAPVSVVGEALRLVDAARHRVAVCKTRRLRQRHSSEQRADAPARLAASRVRRTACAARSRARARWTRLHAAHASSRMVRRPQLPRASQQTLKARRIHSRRAIRMQKNFNPFLLFCGIQDAQSA